VEVSTKAAQLCFVKWLKVLCCAGTGGARGEFCPLSNASRVCAACMRSASEGAGSQCHVGLTKHSFSGVPHRAAPMHAPATRLDGSPSRSAAPLADADADAQLEHLAGLVVLHAEVDGRPPDDWGLRRGSESHVSAHTSERWLAERG
jgi:hypothetical protein